MCDSSLKAKWDYENSIAYAEEKAEERGIEKGIEKGKLEGKLEEAIAIAIEMKKDGIPFTQIAKFTKLSNEEIEKV